MKKVGGVPHGMRRRNQCGILNKVSSYCCGHFGHVDRLESLYMKKFDFDVQISRHFTLFDFKSRTLCVPFVAKRFAIPMQSIIAN